jgi:PAS domain S-box-containing protein
MIREMSNPFETKQNTKAAVDQEELTELRHAVAEFLRNSINSLVSDIDHEVASSVPDYESLTADVVVEVRQSFREFVQIYLDYFEASEFPVKFIRSLATDIGKKWAALGLSLNAVMDAFEAGESHTWKVLTRELVPGVYSASSWVELGRLRDLFNKLVRQYFRRAYEREEDNTVRRQLEEFRALFALGQTIVSTVDLEEVLGQILEVATSLMEARMGSIMLLDDTDRFLEPVVDKGLSRTWVQRERIAAGQSLGGVAIQRNEYVLARDDELAGFELPRAAVGRKIRSALSVPITVDEKPIGVIELYDTTPRTYTDLDITMMMTFGPQAGVAIKNARLFDEERKRRRQAIILTEVAQAVSETRDLDELLEKIAEKTAVALAVDRCSLFFYEPEANALTFMAGYGRSTLQVWLLNQFHVPMSELGQATATALRTKQPVLTEEPGEEVSLESRVFRGPGVKSYLQVPIVLEDELIGLISLEFTRGEGKFSPDDISLADSLARQAAVAIQNRRLQQKLFEQQLVIKNAEVNERLFRERERSEAVLKATPDAVFLIDRDLKVVLINPAAEFLTGWGLEDARGRGCHEVLYGSETAPGVCPGPGCPIDRVFSGEQVAYHEDEIITRSGRKIPSGGTFAPILGPDGRVEMVVAIYRDISEQKELEKYALMQREMDIASGIQSSLLPKESLVVKGVRVNARQQQARNVGGDWYDYWGYGDKLFIVIGDASGTGVGAALFATMAMSAIRVESREHNRIIDILDHVNQNLYVSNKTDSFVTVFFSVLDIPTLTLSYANAGHEDPIFVGPDDKHPSTLESGSRSLLGIFQRATLDVQRREFKPGDRIVLYTDGVIDAKNSKGKFYGLKRLDRFIAANRDLPPQMFIDVLIENVLDFCDGDPNDDITVVVCDLP